MFSKLFYNSCSLCVLPITTHFSVISIYSSCYVICSLISPPQKYWICFTIILLLLRDFLTFHVIRCCYNLVKLLQVQLKFSMPSVCSRLLLFMCFLNFKSHGSVVSKKKFRGKKFCPHIKIETISCMQFV